MIELPADLLASTFRTFRACGGGRRECVVYWTGPADRPDVVDAPVHPHHMSTGGGYQIDDDWLTGFWFDLAHRRQSARVQVHTHPRGAFHSPTDDAWALVHTPGFLSLVIPDFAMGPISLRNTYLAERTAHGWASVPVTERLHLLRGDAG